MKRLVLGFLAVPALLICATVSAQQPENATQPTATVDTGSTVVDEAAPTESMWFYLNEQRRYDDPQLVIRRRAEWKAQQRRMRLESQKWYGYSASRPIANPIPFMGVYSPMWVGNGVHPFHWVGGGLTTVRVSARFDAATTTTTTDTIKR